MKLSEFNKLGGRGWGGYLQTRKAFCHKGDGSSNDLHSGNERFGSDAIRLFLARNGPPEGDAATVTMMALHALGARLWASFQSLVTFKDLFQRGGRLS